MKKKDIKIGDRVKFTKDGEELRGTVAGIHKDRSAVDVSVYGMLFLQYVECKFLSIDDSTITDKEKKFDNTMNSLRSLWKM